MAACAVCMAAMWLLYVWLYVVLSQDLEAENDALRAENGALRAENDALKVEYCIAANKCMPLAQRV